VNFQTGVGHGPGIPQLDDKNCSSCHAADGPEFGMSVAGAHTNPIHSTSLKGLNLEIVEVTNAAPGQTPIVRFKITEDDGTSVDPSTMATLAIRIAGPTTDFTHYISENANSGSAPDGDGYMYAFTTPMPDDAAGTYTVTIDNRRTVTLVDNPEGEDDITVTESGPNPIFHVNVDGGAIVARRQSVDIDKCNVCHDFLSLHGGQRNQIENCATCHNPKASDSIATRETNGVDGGVSISLGVMIHKIHSGTNLSQDYTVYRSRGIYNFNGIAFPGMVSQCSICHIDDVPALPLPETNASVEIAQVGGSTIVKQPATANCTACHDMRDAEAHANLNTTAEGIESCAVCHREGRSASIAQAHANKIFLNVIERTSADPTMIQQWLLHQE
jgi:OmcA/MtrC family decaheme c-type cytochrome